MNPPDEVTRLADARPPILTRTEQIVDAAEEADILDAILADNQRGPATRRYARAMLVGAVAAAVVVFAGTFVGLGHGQPPTTTQRSAAAQPLGSRQEVTLELAGYHFRVPAGFKAHDSSCTPTSAPPAGTPVTPVQQFAISASEAGGCVQVGLAAGTAVVPSAASPVSVGAYQGWQLQGEGTSTLWVEAPVPSVSNIHYLVLQGLRLSASELVSIAETGLTGSPGH